MTAVEHHLRSVDPTPRSWRAVDFGMDAFEKLQTMVNIAAQTDKYRDALTPEAVDTYLVPAIVENRCRILELPAGQMFYTWCRPPTGADMVHLMAGKAPTQETWRSDSGVLFIVDFVPGAVSAARAGRAVAHSMFLTGIADMGERVVMLRHGGTEKERIGYFHVSLKGVA